MPPLLVLVTGAPGSGKTTLAQELSVRAGLPLLAKDDIKESLFDSLGWSDRDRSKRLGKATFELLYLLAERHLEVGRSVLLESNVRDPGRLGEITSRHGARVLEIHCSAPAEVLLARFVERARSAERHPGHVDDETSW